MASELYCNYYWTNIELGGGENAQMHFVTYNTSIYTVYIYLSVIDLILEYIDPQSWYITFHI